METQIGFGKGNLNFIRIRKEREGEEVSLLSPSGYTSLAPLHQLLVEEGVEGVG